MMYPTKAALVIRSDLAERARNRNLTFAIYTEPLFKTTNDIDNRASVAATPRSIRSGSASMPSARSSTR
jgi:hypothetical protein